jgi:acyl dehydratase
LTKADEVLEHMKPWVGKEAPPVTCEVEKGMMMKIPWAVGDPNPLWRDEQYARQTKWGGIIASPTFVEYLRHHQPLGRTTTPVNVLVVPGIRGVANVVGGEEVEYFRPIRPGDVITIVRVTTDAKKRWSKTLNRDVVIQTLEQTFTNQFGELVATHKSTHVKI